MLHAAIKSSLKRGALVTAANWEVVVIQFVAESAFKALLTVPVVGAAFLLALLVGGGVLDLLDGGVQDALGIAITRLRVHPGALVAYLTGLLVVVIGGSVLMFRIKGGTVARPGRRRARRAGYRAATAARWRACVRPPASPSIGLARAAIGSRGASCGLAWRSCSSTD